MGHSVVEFNNKCIIAKDFKVEFWLYIISYEIDKKEPPLNWLLDAKKYWLDLAKNYANGCINVNFDGILDTEEKAIVVRDMCKKIYNDLSKSGETLSREFLNSMHNYKEPFEVKEDVMIQPYLQFIDAVINLLSDQQKIETEYV